FGNTNLFNDDVMQAFQSAVYGVNMPIGGTDFFDAMDACCGDSTAVPGTDYVVRGPNTYSGAAENPLLDGNDATINNIAFGDGQLDVADVYVTFRRALDPTLTWFQRFWTNGVLAAEPVRNLFRGQPNLPAEQFSNADALAASTGTSNDPPAASFSAPALGVAGGQTLLIPINAQINGKYPARIGMFNLLVEPLDGSPVLEEKVEFIPNPNLGQTTLTC